MPVTCAQRGGKWRLIEGSGAISVTHKGTPRDGGGHDSREECMAQARAINDSLSETHVDKNGVAHVDDDEREGE